MSLINRPHDRFFKETMGDTETAQDFLLNYLPDDILQIIDLDNLTIEKDSFIDHDLQESFSDLLYKTSIKGKEAYLYFLFDHKSYRYKNTALQLLKYMVNIWEQKVKEKAASLPVIIPLVVYHGKKEWNIDRTLSGIIDTEDLPESIQRYIPDFAYILYDFSPLSDTKIKGDIVLAVFLEILKATFNKNPAACLNALKKAFRILDELSDKTKGIEYLKTIIVYIMNARKDLKHKDVYNAAKETSTEGSKIVMTIAEKLIKKGVIRGVKRGVIRGTEKTARSSLKKGLDLELIMEITGLDRKRLLELQKEVQLEDK